MDEVGFIHFYLNSFSIVGLMETNQFGAKKMVFFTCVNILLKPSLANFLCILSTFCVFHRK